MTDPSTIIAGMTDAQRKALRWLFNRGGEGVFNRHNVLLAQGELAGVRRATWSRLADTGCLTIEARRVRLTERGKALALTIPREAATVEDDF